jgi:hypothetical protein
MSTAKRTRLNASRLRDDAIAALGQRDRHRFARGSANSNMDGYRADPGIGHRPLRNPRCRRFKVGPLSKVHDVRVRRTSWQCRHPGRKNGPTITAAASKSAFVDRMGRHASNHKNCDQGQLPESSPMDRLRPSGLIRLPTALPSAGGVLAKPVTIFKTHYRVVAWRRMAANTRKSGSG